MTEDTCKWLVDGGWIAIDEATPYDEILEVVQHTWDDVESAPMLMSLRNGPWPSGYWCWEPEGCPASVEPTHYRRLASAAAYREVAAVVRA